MYEYMGHMCNRRAGESCEEEGHVSPEAGKTGERGEGCSGRSGEPRQRDLAKQGAVAGTEEQDRHHTDTVNDSSGQTGCDQSMSSISIILSFTV